MIGYNVRNLHAYLLNIVILNYDYDYYYYYYYCEFSFLNNLFSINYNKQVHIGTGFGLALFDLVYYYSICSVHIWPLQANDISSETQTLVQRQSQVT